MGLSTMTRIISCECGNGDQWLIFPTSCLIFIPFRNAGTSARVQLVGAQGPSKKIRPAKISGSGPGHLSR